MTISAPNAADTVTSMDGTVIAYERVGAGPALILVDCAGYYRELSSFGGLVDLLAHSFTVYHYDRRGRGDSGDTPPYSVEREVEDLAALIETVGGSAPVYGFCSGGMLALLAAASGLRISRIALLEPPIEVDAAAAAAFTAGLRQQLAVESPDAVVEYFLNCCGVPDKAIADMRARHAFAAMEKVVDTFVYDSMIREATTQQLLASVTIPTLVLDSQGSPDNLTAMAATAAEWLPNSCHQRLAGRWHKVHDEVLAPALIDFFQR